VRSELVGRRELVIRARVRGRELFIRAGVEGLVVRAGVEGCSSSFSSLLAEAEELVVRVGAEELVVRVGAGISCKYIC
jgi:hypothetical protein